MRYGIVGSRRRRDRGAVEKFVQSLPKGSVVVSGGCRGVDTWAALAARELGLEVTEFLPRWPEDRSGMKYYEVVKAYHDRNREIAQDCDVLVAFVAPDRKGGTESTIKFAQELKKKVIIL